jgi:outer membrane protein OmpA-like peptidoglycan-associated protein
MNMPLLRILCPLSITLLLAACGSTSRPVALPAGGANAAGSAPGATYGGAPATGFAWSPAMASSFDKLGTALRGSGATVAKTTDQRLWITLPGDLAFEPNRSALKPEARALLDKVVVSLRGLDTAQFRVVGHTDAKGSPAANDALSLDRAASTRDWLVARGMPAPRIAVAGRGSREPVAGNDDEADRARNRRVEILVGDPAKVGAQSAR